MIILLYVKLSYIRLFSIQLSPTRNICMVKIGMGTWTTVPFKNRCVHPYTNSNKHKISKIFMKIRTLKDSTGLKPNLRED